MAKTTFKFIYLFLRERESTSRVGGAERERERERDRIPSWLHAVSTVPDAGFNLTNHEIMT